MCKHCTHITTYAKAQRIDPTRTMSLQRAWMNQFRKRFNRIKKQIQEALVGNDVFGLQVNVSTPTPRAFNFPTSQEKVEAFMEWIRKLIDDELLTVTTMYQIGQPLNAAWTNMYVMDSYKRGLARAKYELKKAGYKLPPIDVAPTFNQPFHLDRVGMLYLRTYEDLKGITDSMSNQISKVLAQGMIDGDNPRMMARKLNYVIDGSGQSLGVEDTLGRFIPARRRAETLARTETVRAYHQANIQEMKNWGVEGVNVQAEWSTAEDGRVCKECAKLQGRVFSLVEIEKLIPLHPNCRCLALPLLASQKKINQSKKKSK